MDEKQIPKSHYIHRTEYSKQERIVGVFVLTAIAILLLLIFISGQTLRLFEGRVQFIAYMSNAIGVSTNTKIRISGIEVGSVKRISLTPDNRFEVTLDVYNEFHGLVRTDSEASISRLAFIGDSVVNITPGSANRQKIPDGGVIKVKETQTIDQVLLHLEPTMNRISASINKIANTLENVDADSLATTLNNAAKTSSNLREISDQIASGKGTMGALVFEQQFYQRINDSLNDLRIVLDDARHASNQTREAAAALPEAIKQFAETAAIIRKQATELPELTADTRELLDDVDRLVDAVSHTWPISSKLETSSSEPMQPQLQPSND